MRDHEPRPLSEYAVSRIIGEHARHCRGGSDGNTSFDIVVDDGHGPRRQFQPPTDWLAYDQSGAFAGSAGAVDGDGKPRIDPTRYVLVADNWLPEESDFAAVRVNDDGTLTGNWLRRPPPPPKEVAGPSDDEGVPLTESTIRRIREEWRTVVAGAAQTPVVKAWRPTFAIAFRPQTGRLIGSTLTPGVQEHEHELVVVLDDAPPSVETLRRVRRHSNGWITWLPTEPEHSEMSVGEVS